MRSGFVYIMSNHRNGVLYTGVTSDLPKRVYEHRTGAAPGFTKRYGLKRLVWSETPCVV
jgi:putative endonuclease